MRVIEFLYEEYLHLNTPGMIVVYQRYTTATRNKPTLEITFVAFEPESPNMIPIVKAQKMCMANFK